jgi:hypothetical protein
MSREEKIRLASSIPEATLGVEAVGGEGPRGTVHPEAIAVK